LSVSEATNLTAQPASGIGSISYLPLGGNGFLAPHSAYLASVGITCDASGGTAELILLRDDRFQHLVQFMQLRLVASTARLYELTIGKATSISATDVTTRVQGITRVGPAGNTTAHWDPPPIFDVTRLQTSTVNTDTVVVTLTALIYNFDIRADKQVPLNVLLENVPRASTLLDGILQ